MYKLERDLKYSAFLSLIISFIDYLFFTADLFRKLFHFFNKKHSYRHWMFETNIEILFFNLDCYE